MPADKFPKANLQSKLSLKRSNSDSLQSTLSLNTKASSDSHEINDQEICCSKQSQKENVSKSPNAEDTLADFKSPKSEKPIINKFKIDSERVKKKLVKTKSKSNVKSRRSTSDFKQPSIALSLLKPQTSDQNEIKESIPCPLCLRPFKDDAACTNHMKICAAKNKISVKQLLDAKKLQDRQAEERKAMGLLATPVLPERKKAFRSKKYSTDDDPQLQLVLAMSESLYQAEQMVELEQAALLAGVPSECIKDMNEEERKTTLQSFGFTTNKPASEVLTNKTKKRKLLGPTILQTRSKEDKDRVLTERIACILTGDDVLTQVQQKTDVISRDEPILLRSKILKGIKKSSNKLWDKSRLTKKFNDFYVRDLKSHFLPLVQQDETAQSADTEEDANLSNISIEYEPIDFDLIINKELEQNTPNLSNVNELEKMDREIEFMRTITLKWRDALNDSAASDLIIHVKNDKQIYVHKLVFHVQCSNIMLDIVPNDSKCQPCIKEKISWIKFEEQSALAFLEFIYCGTIHKNVQIFENPDLLSEVNQLAKLYQIPGLFTYLRKRQKESKLTAVKQSKKVNEDTNIQESNKSHESRDLSMQLQTKDLNSDSLPLSKNVVSLKKSYDRRVTASPDLFESENEEENVDSKESLESSEARDANLKILIDLLHEKENTNSTSLKNKSTEFISSQKTNMNSNRIPSPQSHISLLCSPTKDIHGIITPRNGSPETVNETTIEKMDYDNQEINQAVTPKTRSPEIVTKTTPEKMDYDNQEINEAVTPKTRSPERDNEIIEEGINYNNKHIAEAITPITIRSPEMNDNVASEIEDLINNDLYKAKTPESHSVERMTDYVTHRRLVYANADIDISPTSASLENENETLHSAVTPPRDNEPQFKLKEENNVKPKSDLSLFIDKVRRINAKPALDSDSDSDTPEVRRIRKNPFLKKRDNDSYTYLLNDGHKKNDQRRVISLIEQDALKAQSKTESLNQMTRASTSSSNASSISLQDEELVAAGKTKNTSSSELKYKMNVLKRLQDFLRKKDETSETENSISEDVTVNESELSMYSKYKKDNKHHNSIDKYRKQLNFEGSNKNMSKQTSTVGKISKNSTDENSISKSNTKIEDVTLVSDSDDEEQHRSSNKKDSLVLKVISPEVAKEAKSQPSIINLSDDSDKESVSNDCSAAGSLLEGKSLSAKNIPIKNKKVESPRISDYESKNKSQEDSDEEINKILRIVPNFNNQNESSVDESNQDNESQSHKDVSNKSHSSQHEDINLSPISLIASPESGKLSNEKLNKVNSDSLEVKNKNLNKPNTPSKQNAVEFNAIEEHFEDIHFENDWISEHLPGKSNTNKAVKSNLKPQNSAENRNSQMLSLMTSPILSQSKQKLQTTTSNKTNVKNSQKVKSLLPEQKSENTRKLKTKSASLNNFVSEDTNNDRCNLQRSSSLVTPKQRKNSSNKVGKHGKDVTPPPDYSQLETPELNKRLKKYGLKPQNRAKATLLLNHIYQETHRVSVAQKRTSSDNSSDSDEEPPLKKRDLKKINTAQSSQNCPIIAEEMDYDEADAANILENPVSIKDVFNRILETNKELYTKVLTYEPLPLESLHTMLKENGFKCKINVLMDFLDEQCITFRVQNSKGNRTKKKERRK